MTMYYRMSQTLDSGEIIVAVPPNQTQSTLLETNEISDPKRHLQDRLQTFLKGILKALGVAQIMIGVKCMLYGIVGSVALNYEQYRMIFHLFYTGFPMWAALSFIISGSLTAMSAKKQTKSLLKANLGANTLSTLVSIVGNGLLAHNFTFFHYDCKENSTCLGIKSIATVLVVILMILICLEIFISLPLSMVKYGMDGKNIDWKSVVCCKSDLESPYQDLLPQTSVHLELDPSKSAVAHHPMDGSRPV